MPAPVTRITVHHQGGGVPSNTPIPNARYSVWIGSTAFTIIQRPWTSWATFGYNHVSYDICLSGDRMVEPVTDYDLTLIAQACQYARNHGWLAAVATTYPHGTLHPPPAPYPSGSSPTDCPGTKTIARWPEVVAATRSLVVPSPGGSDVPADTDIVDALVRPEGAWKLQYDGGVQTIRGMFYGSYPGLPASVRNDPTRRFLTIMDPLDGTVGYTLVSTKGESYTFNTKP